MTGGAFLAYIYGQEPAAGQLIVIDLSVLQAGYIISSESVLVTKQGIACTD